VKAFVVKCCIAVPALLAGCAGVEDTVLPSRIDYACANNKVLQVARAQDARSAAAVIDGKQVVLSRADSAAQEKYSDGRYTLYLDGERAMLEDQGRVLYGPCSAGPLPKAQRYRY
jgi:membrane-bound inhibitor of C-type lysozyme